MKTLPPALFMFFALIPVAIIVGLVLLVSCESDANKLERLEREQHHWCGLAAIPQGNLRREIDSLRKTPDSASYRHSAEEILSEWHTKCQLATRELNAFMLKR